LFWVNAAADLGEVLRRTEEHRTKRLPVIENRRVVGMISEAGLARSLSEHQLAEFVQKVYAAPCARTTSGPEGASSAVGRSLDVVISSGLEGAPGRPFLSGAVC
jgi:CBS-domain-containing membrane protein